MARKADSNPTPDAAKYRKKAEKLYRARAGNKSPASLQEAQNRLRELEVQKIELELRNQDMQASQDWLTTVLESITDGFVSHDRDFRYTYVNREAEELLGKTRQELLGKSLWECFPEVVGSRYEVELRRAMAKSTAVHFDEFHLPSARWTEIHAYPSSIGLAVYFRDITDRKAAAERLQWELAVDRAQAELSGLLVAPSMSIDGMARAVLECGRRLTQSDHGFVAFVDGKTGDLVCLTLTDMLGRECRVPAAKTTFPRGPDGKYPAMWGYALSAGQAFYTNSPKSHPRYTGVPKGHVAVNSFLAVPVIVAGELAGQIALANSCRPYTDNDLEAVKRLATSYALALQRLRADGAMRHAKDELELRVQQRNAQLRELASELTLAEQRERGRLAELLHDRLQQLLVAARMKLEVLHHRVGDEQLSQMVRQLDNLLDRSISESRSLAVELSPPILNQEGLAAGLTWLGRYMEKIHGLRVEVEAPSALMSIQEATRTLLYQVARELLFNVVKHAQADHAALKMWQTDDGRVSMEVEDKGVGFDPAKQHPERTVGGLGLHAIGQRLELMGGHLRVDSAPGKGTRIVVQVPG